MKRLTSIVCLLIFAATVPAGSADGGDAIRAVVRVPSHGGSATIIATEQGNTYLLTAAHLFESAQGRTNDPIVIDGEDVPLGTARRIGINPEADLALIQLSAGPAKHVAPVALTPTKAKHLLSVGYDEMRVPSTKQACTLLFTSQGIFFTRERPWHGRSGGALLDLDTGYVVGVVSGYETTPPYAGIYVSQTAIRQFLESRGWK
jgi:hypothetical protein